MFAVLCGAPLFSDPKSRASGKLKSTQFCNYMPLSSRFKEGKMSATTQDSSGAANSIHKNQSTVLVKMYQVDIFDIDNNSYCQIIIDYLSRKPTR